MQKPKSDPVFAILLNRRMVELDLMMMGLPKAEIDKMTQKELQVTRHLLSYMSRQARGGKEENYA